MPPVIIHVIAARSETGKTTLIEGLLPELAARGLRVAALKGNLHHYNLDLPGKDTWRFLEAGAGISGMITPGQFILIGRTPAGDGLAAAARLLDNFDLVLVEGDKKSGNPKIELIREAVTRERAATANVVAVVSDIAGPEAGRPVFGLEDYAGLARFICHYYFEQDKPAAAGLTHFDTAGRAHMVDVSAKEQTLREAYARGEVVMARETLARIREGSMAKGDVLGVAQVAAIMAVKETGRLVPMAHPLPISGVKVDFKLLEEENKVEIGVKVKVTGQTGVEMEALTGASVAALTIYDMCKAIDKNMVIQNIRLLEKKGGRSGHYRREQ